MFILIHKAAEAYIIGMGLMEDADKSPKFVWSMLVLFACASPLGVGLGATLHAALAAMVE